jgi:DNA-binding transcriptional LysR family regulator
MALPSNQLEAFLAVSQTLNFTKAAEALHITQSALSQRIMNLEKELETTLFIRDRAGLRLTEAAQSLVRYCRCKNSLEEEFLSELSGTELNGSIRIGGFSSVMHSVILPSLAELLTQNKKLRLQIIVDELDNLPALLHRGEIDFMILDKRDSSDELEGVSLGTEKNVLVQKKRYRGEEIFIDHDENDRVTLEYLRLAGKKRKKIERHYLDDIHGLLSGARAGLGRAVVPRHLLVDEKDLEVVDPEIVLEYPVYLYFYTQPYYSRLHQQVVEALVRNTRQFLGAWGAASNR